MKNVLYLGLNAPLSTPERTIIHYPIIQISPRCPTNAEISKAFNHLHLYTHYLLTSQTSVRLLIEFLHFFKKDLSPLQNKHWLAIGKKTAQAMHQAGFHPSFIAKNESSEGIVEELKHWDLSGSHFFWPHSALSRPVLKNFFLDKQIPFTECILYDTFPGRQLPPPPSLEAIDEIIFTSPSCVDAFLTLFPNPPKHLTFKGIGPITQDSLKKIITL